MAITSHDVVEISERTLHDCFSFVARTPRGAVAERPSLLLTSTGTQHGVFNRAYVRAPLGDPRDVIAEAIAFFDDRGEPFICFVPAALAAEVAPAALDAGLTSSGTVEGMVAAPLPAHTDVPGLEISIVRDYDELLAWIRASEGGFGVPEGMFRELMPPSFLDYPDAVWLAGRVGAEVVANSGLVVTDEIAGIYSVSTLPEYRRRRFGAAMTSAAIAEGARRGCTIAALQPSAAGRPVYSALGFRSAALFVTFSRPGVPTE